MSVALTSVGSWGDVFPLLRIGHELRKRGHGVVLALPPQYESAVRAEGFAFHSVGGLPPAGDDAATRALDASLSHTTRTAMIMQHLLPDLERGVEDLVRLARDVDAICAMPTQLAAPMVAELTGVDWVTLTVYATYILTRRILPVGLEPPAFLQPFAAAANPLLWRMYLRRMRALDPQLNEVRSRLGLRPVRDGYVLGSLSPQLCLVLMSEAYWPRPPDWPSRVKLTGFADWDSPVRWEEPAELEAFLADGEPPVVFTLGTSTAQRPERFFQLAIEAAMRSKRRAIFLLGVPFNGLWEQQYGAHGVHSPSLAAWPYVPLSRLLHRCSAVVHPGGYGTTAATIRAGLPALVIPRVFDQGFNAGRVKKLGVGRTLAWAGLTAVRLADELRLVLDDPVYRSNAVKLGKVLTAEDGAVKAADEIESFLVKRARRTAQPGGVTPTAEETDEETARG